MDNFNSNNINDTNQINDDTIKLLRECNSGLKMGVNSIDEVMDHVRNEDLRTLLNKSRDSHIRLGDKTHEYLISYHDEGKEPPMVARMMSKIKTEVKFTEENSERTVAELITDGCDMGIKSLYQYLHKYVAASNDAKNLAEEVIEVEEELRRDMTKWL